MNTPDELICAEARDLAEKLPIRALTVRAWKAASILLDAKSTPEYADTWTYLTQAANGYELGLNPVGYYAESNQAFCVVGIFRRPFNGELAVHLINPVGARAADLVLKLCYEIWATNNCAIYVKKAHRELCSALKRTGCFLWDESFAWHPQAPQEDDTYPELLLDVVSSLSLFEVGRLNQARDKYGRFLNRTKSRNVAWHSLTSSRYSEARAIIERFFCFKADDHIDISQPCDYENMLSKSSESWNADRIFRQMCVIDGKPAALLVMEGIRDSSALGLYCNLSLYQDFKYISEFVLHRALQVAHDNGFVYVNVGGSESKGLHDFKSKFQPVDQKHGKWLVYTGERP